MSILLLNLNTILESQILIDLIDLFKRQLNSLRLMIGNSWHVID